MTAGKLIVALAIAAAATPAVAGGSLFHHSPPTSWPSPSPSPTPTPSPSPTPVPEPSDAGLFLLGVVGVAAGRWMHARRARRDGTKDQGE